MRERIIETEEYMPSRFREVRRKSKHRSSREPQKSKDNFMNPSWSMLDTIIIESCVSAVAIGLIVRLGIVVYYILSCHRVTYDMDISLFGLVAKFFWIWFDSIALKGWMKYIYPSIPRNNSRVTIVISLTFRAVCCFISGYTVQQIVANQRLSFFFAVNKSMVMGGIVLILVTLFHRMGRLVCELSSQDTN